MTLLNRSGANFVSDSLNLESRTVEFCFTSGAKGLRAGPHGRFYEQLSVTREHCDLSSFVGGPMLLNHGVSDVDNIVGRVTDAKIENGMGYCTVKFGSDEKSDSYFRKVQDGLLRDCSIGYQIHELTETSKRGDKVPTFLATKWEVKELSFVTLPFDSMAKVREEEVLSNINFIRSMENMTITKEELELKTREAETRIASIYKEVTSNNLAPEVAERFISQGMTVDQVRTAVTATAEAIKMDRSKNVQSPTSSAEITVDERDTIRESALSALLHRGDSTEPLVKRANEYRHMSLFEMAKSFIPVKDLEGSKSHIATRALTTSDMGIVLGQLAAAKLQKAYKKEGIKTYEPFCVNESLPDYKPQHEIKFDETGSDLEKIIETENYTYGAFGASEKFSYKLDKFGKVFRISEVLIVNDSYNVIDRFMSSLGDITARHQERTVYQELLNGKYIDGKGLFSLENANMSNKEAPVAICDDSIDEMVERMRQHKYGDGPESIAVEPKFLIFGPKQERYLRRYLYANFQPIREEDVKTYQHTFTPILTHQIQNADWYCMSNPSLFPTIKTLTMEGSSGPEISHRIAFESDSVEVKIKFIWGVAAVDHRGVYKNFGKAPEPKKGLR